MVSVKGNQVYQKLYDIALDRALKDASLTYEDRIEIAKDLSRGLVSLHKHGIIHADLKPDNAFLKLCDSEGHKK